MRCENCGVIPEERHVGPLMDTGDNIIASMMGRDINAEG